MITAIPDDLGMPGKSGRLTQWDHTRLIFVYGLDEKIPEDCKAHISSPNDDHGAYVVPCQYISAKKFHVSPIPDELLTIAGRIDILINHLDQTVAAASLTVNPAEKPDDYVYSESEFFTMEEWQQQVVAALDARYEEDIKSATDEIDAKYSEQLKTATDAATASESAAKNAQSQVSAANTASQNSAKSSEASAQSAQAAAESAKSAENAAKAMSGTFDFTGYLRYEIVSAMPTTQEEGVLYIVPLN